MNGIQIALLALAAFLGYKLIAAWRARARLISLRGPPSPSWFFGLAKDLFQGDASALFEQWFDEYGPAFQVAGQFGSRRTVLFDPVAISYFFSKETYSFTQSGFQRKAIEGIIGKGLLYAEGESHRRQRRALTPAFSVAALRNLIPVFYDSAYKVKSNWDAIIHSSSSNEAIIDVQKWMNSVSLDSIGIAGFGHDFGSLDGKPSSVRSLFDSIGSTPHSSSDKNRRPLSLLLPLLTPVLPILMKIPTKRSRVIRRLHESMAEISNVLLDRSRKEREAGLQDVKGSAGQTIIGALLKAENSDSSLTMTPDEVLSQMKVLILAGYETTSISLTWALIELALNPDKQDKLRQELSEFSHSDPSYEQLTNALPYLNCVTREILRLHPPLGIISRVAAKDEIIPFSNPITLPSKAGDQPSTSLPIAQGAQLIIPVRAIQRSTSIWGPSAKQFLPERWATGEDGLPEPAKAFGGVNHLLTFVDGHRICLGRGFALAEFKSVLSVLVRNFVFEMRDGPGTKIEEIVTILRRPKVEGEQGFALPMRIRRYES